MKYTLEGLKKDTLKHKDDVQHILNEQVYGLDNRALFHDDNKLDKEDAIVLRDALNGDTNWNKWNHIHMSAYDHHIEYYQGDLTKISLGALMEMVADGASACYRRQGIEYCTFDRQYKFYLKKGFDEQLATILTNEFVRNVEMLKDRDE